MDRKAVKVINAVTGSGLKLEESEERVDMCKAIAELREDGWREGKAEGLIELVCKKIIKGKTIPVIADELEQEESVIEPIYHAALQCAPEYDYEKIYKLLKDGQAQES